MQQVQDRLDFAIDTPDDDELKRMFQDAHKGFSHPNDMCTVGNIKPSKSYSAKTKNQKKRARKAQRKARKVTA